MFGLAGKITTLRLEKALEAGQFFFFHKAASRKDRMTSRWVVVGGSKTRLDIYLPPGPDEWLCPYFDPVERALRFRRQDGEDIEARSDLYDLAHSRRYRHLLHLAHSEGLLDKIPGACASSRLPQAAANPENFFQRHL